MPEAASEHRKPTAAATSSGRSRRWTGAVLRPSGKDLVDGYTVALRNVLGQHAEAIGGGETGAHAVDRHTVSRHLIRDALEIAGDGGSESI